MVVFPAKGQTPQQQAQDEGECYAWSKQQTGIDPFAAPTPAPTSAQAIEDVSATDDILWVKALDDVEGKLFALRRDQRWRFWRRALPRLDTLRPDHVPA